MHATRVPTVFSIGVLLSAVLLLSLVATAAAQEHDLADDAPFELELVTNDLIAPLHLTHMGDGRLFVVDQVGVVHAIGADGELEEEPFLDVTDRLVPLRATYDERGLLGMAFHPDAANNGRVFVYYSAPRREGAPEDWDHTSHLSEFTVGPDGRADPQSERVLMQIDQPQFNHNGGALAFGADGFLYVALGDGGDADDTGIGHPPLGHGQDLTTILGNILRIDVDAGDPYGVPDDNPFVGFELAIGHPFSGDRIPEEIWAWGFRHPWRMSFDRDEPARMFVNDTGQHLWEEVNLVTEPGNFGWNLKEGTHGFDPDRSHELVLDAPRTGPLGELLIDPILEYPNNRGRYEGVGVAVIGGYLYRGGALPDLAGQYVFGDWSRYMGQTRGVLMIGTQTDPNLLWSWREVGELDGAILGFGQDADGELYVLLNGNPGPAERNGSVYRLVPRGTADEAASDDANDDDDAGGVDTGDDEDAAAGTNDGTDDDTNDEGEDGA